MQQQRIDCTETFALVVRYDSLSVLKHRNVRGPGVGSIRRRGNLYGDTRGALSENREINTIS